jgi:hypothetical protein
LRRVRLATTFLDLLLLLLLLLSFVVAAPAAAAEVDTGDTLIAPSSTSCWPISMPRSSTDTP